MEQILSILQWLIPSGSLVALLTWITSRRLRIAREDKSIHDAYKTMYDDVHQSLIDLSEENKIIRRTLVRLEATLALAHTCRYWGTCPIKHELRKQQTAPQVGASGEQQYGVRRHRTQDRVDEPSPSRGRDGDDSSSSGEPP